MEARFRLVSSIIQLNQSYYIISDRRNHCIRVVKVTTFPDGNKKWTTSTYAGKCTSKGSKGGNRLEARFSFCTGMIKKDANLYFINNPNKIMQLNMHTDIVTTVHNSSHWFNDLVLAPGKGGFYVTVYYGILHIKEGTKTQLLSKFSSALFNYPWGLKWLDNITLLVADYNTHSIKVLDFKTKQVQQICSG